MTKKSLFSGTSALVAAAFLGTSAMAGQVGSKDAMSVTLGGEFRYIVGLSDQDVSAGAGRGYRFHGDESEIVVEASNTADNGILYGVVIELNAGSGDVTAADEAYAYIDSPVWGRLEMGDKGDATDSMFAESDDILVGRAGPDGDATDFVTVGTAGIGATGNTITGEATKVVYFTPRLGGFQAGASLTPDSGQASGAAGQDSDADGDFENVIGLAANWEGKFDDAVIVLSLTGEFGEAETSAGADNLGEVATSSVGGTLTFGGFGFGAGYVDFGEQSLTQAAQAAGADAGSYWTVGGSYNSGPWGVSLNWFESTKSNTTGISDTDVTLISLDAAYTVAPGWDLAAALHVLSADNINATAAPVNNDGTVFLISNQFTF
jgi:outer membrane protein OmpU